MSCGVTPVSTRLPGAMEILDGERCGYVVPVGDVEKMAEGIEKALQHPIDPDVLRERASFFSVENSIRQYMELIEGQTTEQISKNTLTNAEEPAIMSIERRAQSTEVVCYQGKLLFVDFGGMASYAEAA